MFYQKKMYILKFLALFYFITPTSNKCIDVDNEHITSLTNSSFNKNCYDYTIDEQEECCDYFLLHQKCINTYTNCIEYERYIINNIKSHCQYYNTTIFNINYSDSCHSFTLQLDPYCCENLLNDNCINWYSNCNSYNNSIYNIHKCVIPTKYTNNFCTNYTYHIDSNCCDNFNDHCNQIYIWCMVNNPNQTSVTDLFLHPQSGFTMGSNLQIYNDKTLDNCLHICVDTSSCKSIDYIPNTNHCYVNKHVIGDYINNQYVILNTHYIYTSYYYEKILNMPYDNTYCNVQRISYIGDGVCDTVGGYNTADCDYDGGDCCEETCNPDFKILCGINNYYCIDPAIINTQSPSSSPTTSPSSSPTTSPSSSPTTSPSSSPTTSPSSSPTTSPSSSPTTSPSSSPTTSPSSSPTTLPSIQYNKETSKSDGDDNEKVITVLLILVVLLTLLLLGGSIAYVKYKYSAKVFMTSGAHNMHMANPVYDKSEYAIENREYVDEDESDVYQDPEYDDDLSDDIYINNEYNEESIME